MTTRRAHSIQHDFTLYEAAGRNGQVFPDRLAFVDDSRRLTFKQFFDLVSRLVAGLRIAPYKKTKHLQFVDSLPKTGSGEIDRAKVKAKYGG